MIVWLIGFCFFVGYSNLDPKTWKETVVFILAFFLWPIMLGAAFGGHLTDAKEQR